MPQVVRPFIMWLMLLLHMLRHLPVDASCIPNDFIRSFQLMYPLDGTEVASVYYHRMEAELVIGIDEFHARNSEFHVCLHAHSLPNEGNVATSIYDKCGLSGLDTVPVPGRPGWNYLEVTIVHEGIELCHTGVTVHCCTNQTSGSIVLESESAELSSYRFMLEELRNADQTNKLRSNVPFNCSEHWEDALRGILRGLNRSTSMIVFVGIKSASFHTQLRRAIRSTWLLASRKLHPDVVILPFFLVGRYRDSMGSSSSVDELSVHDYLQYEQYVHKDLLLGEEISAADSYHTLAEKVLGFVGWIHALQLSLSSEAFLLDGGPSRTAALMDFLVVCDDDVFVDVDQLKSFIGGLRRPEDASFYGGEVLEYRLKHKFLPQREERHRNFLSRAHFPLDQLPPFALGNFYILSADNARFLADNSRVLRPVGTLEDLSIAVWMMGLQVFPTHMPGVCDLERCLYDSGLYSTREEEGGEEGNSSCKGAGEESRLIAIAGLKDPFEFELLFNYTRYRSAHYRGCCNHRDALLVLRATIEELRRRKQGIQQLNSDLALLVAAFSSVSVGIHSVVDLSTGDPSHDDPSNPPLARPTMMSPVVNVVVGWSSSYAVALLRDIIIISTGSMSDDDAAAANYSWFYLKEDIMMKFDINRRDDMVFSMTEDDFSSLRQYPPILLLSALDLAIAAEGGEPSAATATTATAATGGPSAEGGGFASNQSMDLFSGPLADLRADLKWTPLSELLLQRAIAVAQPDTVVVLSGEPIDLSAMSDSAMRSVDLLLLTLSDDKFLPRWAAFPSAHGDLPHGDLLEPQPNGRSGSTIPALHLPVLTSSFHEMGRAAPDQRIEGLHCVRATYCSPPDLLSSYAHRRAHSGCEDKSRAERTRGVAYLYMNCNRPLRELFFSILLSRFEASGINGQVEAIGACMGGVGQLETQEADPNSNRVVEKSRFTTSYIDRAIEIYRDFKFVIAFENNAVKGYITEKLSNAYLAGSIPIYWGAPDVNDYFNPDSMINCNHFESMQDCAGRVVEVYNNATLYDTMASAAPMRGDDERSRYEAWRKLFPWHAVDSEWSGSDAVHEPTEYAHRFGSVLREALTGHESKKERL